MSLAAPAAASEKVVVPEFTGSDEFEVLVSFANPDWFGPFQCSGDIYYGGSAVFELTLWYKNGETDKFPEGKAWPWIKGRNTVHGIDYFSAGPNMSGKVASGKFKTTTQLSNHTLGNPETWSESNSGKNWGIQIPGAGTVHHESGNFRGTVQVTHVPGQDPIFDFFPIGFNGNSTFDFEELCAYFGFDAEFPT
jgi:hypothetical protein